MLTYPDFKKPFKIYTDASKVQLGAVIVQGEPGQEKIVAFFYRKLNPAQCKYTVAELELLSIIEVLLKYKNILLGMEIHIFPITRILPSRTFPVTVLPDGALWLKNLTLLGIILKVQIMWSLMPSAVCL